MSEHNADDIADELVPDPAKLPEVIVLRGYAGKSDRAHFSRLYVNLTFTDYVEVADADIVARRSLTADHGPLAGTLLWVKRSATLLRATISSAQQHATFLKGEITAGASRRARIEVPMARRQPNFGGQPAVVTDPLYYSTCRGSACGDPDQPDLGCCLGPETTIV